MATNLDLTHDIRGKIFAAIKADSELSTTLTGFYPQTVPDAARNPFGKMGAPISTPQFVDGGDGTQYSAAVHCFTKKKPGVTDDPEVQAMTINAAFMRVLNAMEGIDIGDGLTLDVYPRQAQVMQDGDADSFHGFVLFDAVAG